MSALNTRVSLRIVKHRFVCRNYRIELWKSLDFRTLTSVRGPSPAVQTCRIAYLRAVDILCLCNDAFDFWDYIASSRISSVGITTGYGLDFRVSSPSKGKRFFSSAQLTSDLRPTNPPIQWVAGALSAEVKRPGREADHSSPSSVDVIGGAIPPLLHASSRSGT
jgi:hypothetical protein